MVGLMAREGLYVLRTVGGRDCMLHRLTEALRVSGVGVLQYNVRWSFALRRLHFLLTCLFFVLVAELIAEVLHQVHVSFLAVRRLVSALAACLVSRLVVFLAPPTQPHCWHQWLKYGERGGTPFPTSIF